MTGGDDGTARPPKAVARGERLAAALRANLRRRKDQARRRAGTDDDGVGEDRAGDDAPDDG